MEFAVTVAIILSFLGIFAAALGLPGSFIIFLAAVIGDLGGGFQRLGFKALLLLFMVALLAEIIGFLMEMRGNFRFLLTKQNFFFALLGACLGFYLLTPFLWGLGALLGIFGGAFLALLFWEMKKQMKMKPSLRTTAGSFLWAALTVALKGVFAITMTATVLINIYS